MIEQLKNVAHTVMRVFSLQNVIFISISFSQYLWCAILLCLCSCSLSCTDGCALCTSKSINLHNWLGVQFIPSQQICWRIRETTSSGYFARVVNCFYKILKSKIIQCNCFKQIEGYCSNRQAEKQKTNLEMTQRAARRSRTRIRIAAVTSRCPGSQCATVARPSEWK